MYLFFNNYKGARILIVASYAFYQMKPDRGRTGVEVFSNAGPLMALLDDLKAREEAKARKLAVKGTIGVMVQAYRNGLVTLDEMGTIYEAIIASDDIWISSGLCCEVLNRLKSEPRDHMEGSDL